MSRLTLLTGEKEVVKCEMLRRFVPTPGGVTFGADKFNPVLDMVHREDLNPNFPRCFLTYLKAQIIF